ncbi:MAG: S41 family peptidase [Candidatus Dadabacteria bacterium]|nr:S41 family peptidase [Candidatus Dadabacteria bacterium]MDE0292079.1 S41 family peptidase [Candidatus Dadabacteria bacterium]MDE0476497.1 S41 family peptidase [Candidatus Dadabacteria bacterium]
MTKFRFFFIVYALIPASLFSTPLLAKEDTYRGLSDFAKALNLIEKNYVEEVSSEQLTQSAIKGMFDSLDPYSVYLSSEGLRNLEIGTMGEFEGIGIEITVRDGFLTVISPIEGSPAQEAGVKSGDVIISIDGESTEKTNIVDALDRIRGREGTKVDIVVRRDGTEETHKFTITRRIVKLKSVESRLIEKDIGYIKLSQFHRDSADEFLSSYKGLEEENGEKLGGLVLDLRNNPGGLLEQALALSDMFLDKGLILNVKGRSELTSKEYFAREGMDIPTNHVAVIVNRGSASASEVLAGALKDSGRAKIVGTRTFGKGSVQSVIELSGETGVKITTARLFTPKGILIDDKGIEPDIFVESGDKDAPSDPQLARALETVKHM